MIGLDNAPELVRRIDQPGISRLSRSRRPYMAWIELGIRTTGLPIRVAGRPLRCPSCESKQQIRLGRAMHSGACIYFRLRRGDVVIMARPPRYRDCRVLASLCPCGRLVMREFRPRMNGETVTTSAHPLSGPQVDAIRWMMGELL